MQISPLPRTCSQPSAMAETRGKERRHNSSEHDTKDTRGLIVGSNRKRKNPRSFNRTDPERPGLQPAKAIIEVSNRLPFSPSFYPFTSLFQQDFAELVKVKRSLVIQALKLAQDFLDCLANEDGTAFDGDIVALPKSLLTKGGRGIIARSELLLQTTERRSVCQHLANSSPRSRKARSSRGHPMNNGTT